MPDDSFTIRALDAASLANLHASSTSGLLSILLNPEGSIGRMVRRELDLDIEADRDLMASVLQATAEEIDRRIPATPCDCTSCVAHRSGR